MRVPNIFKMVSLVGGLMLGQALSAAPLYEGVLTDNLGNPIATPVVVKLDVTDPAGTCSLYKETHNVSPNAEGYFSVTMGEGTLLSKATVNSVPVPAIDQVFANQISFVGPASCGYSPGLLEARKLRIWVSDDSGSTWDDLGSMPLQPTAFAAYAGVATSSDKVGIFASTNLLRVDDSGTPGAAAPFTSSQFSELQNLIGGTSNLYLKPGTNGAALVPQFSGVPSTPQTGQMWYDTTTNSMKYYDGSATQSLGTGGGGGGTVTSVTTGAGLVGGPITTTGALAVDVGTTANKIVQLDGSGKLPAVDGTYLTNVSASAIGGYPLFGSPGANGQLYVYNGGSQFQARYLYGSDVRSSIGGNAPFFPAACTASQKINYNPVTDILECQNIVLAPSKLTAPITYFVRSDGNDACDGTTNAGGASGLCGFANIQKALDALPEIIDAVATIQLDGTLVQNVSHVIDKRFGPNGKLIIQGGASIDSNATSAGFQPLFMVSSRGMSAGLPSVQFKNLNIYETDTQVNLDVNQREMFMIFGGVALFEGVTINNVHTGISVQGGFAMLNGIISISLKDDVNRARGLSAHGGGSVEFMGSSLTIGMGALFTNNRKQTGIQVSGGGAFRASTGPVAINMSQNTQGNGSGHQAVGLEVSGGDVELGAGVTISGGNSTNGAGNLPIQVMGGKLYQSGGALTISAVASGSALRVSSGGSFYSSGTLSIDSTNATTSDIVSVSDGGVMTISGSSLSLTGSGSAGQFVSVRSGGIFKYNPMSTSTFSLNGSGGVAGFRGETGGILEFRSFGGSATYTMSGFSTLFSLDTGGMAITDGTGSGGWDAGIVNLMDGKFIKKGGWGPNPPAPMGVNHGLVVFDSGGTQNTWPVPAGVSSVKISMIGGGGGCSGCSTASGGKGASLVTYMPVNGGDTLYVQTGSAGLAGSSGGSSRVDLNVGYGSGTSWVYANGGVVGTGTTNGTDGLTSGSGGLTLVQNFFSMAGKGTSVMMGDGGPGIVVIEY